MGNAHVFEHADRDDPIVNAGLLAVIAQEELRPLAEAALRARARDTLSCSSERVRPVTRRSEPVGEPKAQSAPAGADVEHLHAGLQQQLGGDVPAFCRCASSSVSRASKVGAGYWRSASRKRSYRAPERS